MAYERSNPIQRIGPQGAGNSLWTYVDGDALTVIDGTDYFLLEIDRMNVGDIVIAVGNNVAGVASVVSNDGTAIDLSNFGGAAEAAVDSD